jgi:hypothetical protein
VPQESDKTVDLLIDHLPYDAATDGADSSPLYYLYRSHPWYPYAVNSNDHAVWQKVTSACTLCALSDRPMIRSVAFNQCFMNANREQQKAFQGYLSYPKGDARVTIPLGSNSQSNASLYTYKMSPHFQELESQALNQVVLEPDTIDNACKACIIDVLPQNTQNVCQALKNDPTLNSRYADLKNTLEAQDLKGLGDHPLYRTVTPCVSSCLGSLAAPQKGKRFQRALLNSGQSAYPSAQLIFNRDSHNPLPYHW